MNVFQKGVDSVAFFERGLRYGYSMQEGLVDPGLCGTVEDELRRAGELVDENEMQPVSLFNSGMPATRLLHEFVTRAAILAAGEDAGTNPFPRFSVRVFKPGRHGTTIHRNDPSVGPMAVGITLSGSAPFNVYDQYQLPYGEVIPLNGDGYDPEPRASMEARVGAAWLLCTENEAVPHCSGLVDGIGQRALLIFYKLSFMDY